MGGSLRVAAGAAGAADGGSEAGGAAGAADLLLASPAGAGRADAAGAVFVGAFGGGALASGTTAAPSELPRGTKYKAKPLRYEYVYVLVHFTLDLRSTDRY